MSDFLTTWKRRFKRVPGVNFLSSGFRLKKRRRGKGRVPGPETPPVRGEVTRVNQAAIEGWVAAERQEESLEVSMLVDGKVVKIANADKKYRGLSERCPVIAAFRFPMKEWWKELSRGQEIQVHLEGVPLEFPSGKNSLVIEKEERSSFRKLKRAVKKGEEKGYLDRLIAQREEEDAEYISSFYYAARLIYRKGNREERREGLKTVLAGLKIEEFSEFLVKRSRQLKIPLEGAASFKASLTMRTKMRELGGFAPEWKLNHKVNSYQFVDLLGVRRPRRLGKYYRCCQLPLEEKIVVKPLREAGSAGVYLVFADDHILNIKEKKKLIGWQEMVESMQEDLASGKVRKDQWIAEELITSSEGIQGEEAIPKDMKFYCFYGKVALILEMLRYPKIQHCWWSPQGEILQTGKYEDTFFQGDGFQPEDVELAGSISAEIPAPFVRIDFLKIEEGLVLGEFTPRPGHYEAFNEEYDRWLGEQFLEAEARLHYDLLMGKKFAAYQEYLQTIS